tara:strand:- start:370 stop:636 length:267 start_codon:yes stop_codon:yes gene_type:complete
MKIFEDLEFKKHSAFPHFKSQALMEFDNKYGISVVNGQGAYCSEGTYEVAVLFEGNLTYDTHITDDVLGHLSPKEITDIMKDIQELTS